MSAGDFGQIRLRNESDETGCYSLLGARRGRDALLPDKVLLPGEELDPRLSSGAPTRVRILDCAERPLFEREVVVDDAHNVVKEIEVR